MLPFLMPKKTTGSTIELEAKGDAEAGDDTGLMSAAEDLIAAIHAKDATGVAAALKAAICLADSEEGEV